MSVRQSNSKSSHRWSGQLMVVEVVAALVVVVMMMLAWVKAQVLRGAVAASWEMTASWETTL